MLPDPPRLQVEASRSAFDQVRALQNSCLELAGETMGTAARLERLAALSWALLGPGEVRVLVPGIPGEPWVQAATEPEAPHRVELPVWARNSWPAGLRDETDRARIVATLTRLAGPFRSVPHRDRLVKPVVLPSRDPTRGILAAAVEVTRSQGDGFRPAEGQLLEDLCLATAAGLTRVAP
jgi:hypothetical protein